MAKHWVGIADIELKSAFRHPQFSMHDTPSMTQAQEAPGNVFASAGTVTAIEHTLAVWEV